MAEHSYADALTVAHMWEWVMTGERLCGYGPDGHAAGWGDPAAQDPVVRRHPSHARAHARARTRARTHTSTAHSSHRLTAPLLHSNPKP